MRHLTSDWKIDGETTHEVYGDGIPRPLKKVNPVRHLTLKNFFWAILLTAVPFWAALVWLVHSEYALQGAGW
jgi:hypothetical protein